MIIIIHSFSEDDNMILMGIEGASLMLSDHICSVHFVSISNVNFNFPIHKQ